MWMLPGPEYDMEIDVREDDSTIYLFGSELYCGWCLEAFSCPVRLKIHCHIEHLSTCACGKRFCDKRSLWEHVSNVGCSLPAPFQWSHFVALPSSEVGKVEVAETGRGSQSVADFDDESVRSKSVENATGKAPKSTAVVKRTADKKVVTKHKKKVTRECRLQNVIPKIFYCHLCLFQSVHKTSWRRHMCRTHGKKHLRMISGNSSAIGKPQIGGGVASVKTGTPHDASVRTNICGDSESANSSSCGQSFQSEGNDDTAFIHSCFSLHVVGKPFCCILCREGFDKWAEATAHIYNSHLSAVHQWRDGRSLNGDGSGEQSEKKLPGDGFVFDSRTDILPVTDAPTAPVPMKELLSGSDSERKPVSPSKDMAAAMKLISRRCKFCHRVCSNESNCRRHEAVCRHRLQSSKFQVRRKHCKRPKALHRYASNVRKIDNIDMYFCSRCGYSDSKLCVVHGHLRKKHVFRNRLFVRDVQPEHDFVGTMNVGVGSFVCSICGVGMPARSKMLLHLRRHSSVVTNPKTALNILPQLSSVKVESVDVEPAGGSARPRSCPKCRRKFPTVAKYLSHRAICRAIHSRPKTPLSSGSRPRHTFARSELSQFCEQTAEGRWRCLFCDHLMGYRGDLYKHIRAKHKLSGAEVDVQKFLEEMANGRWRCTLCKCCYKNRGDARKHVRIKHFATSAGKPAAP